ncbi:hypothetical protein F4779DRAFT_271350 [Xylariaceae sp. FL0662B]|nr:hypothetical protein F4779DRAFT_271350 [Xylariaceae sp. FL0662B]
MAPNTPPSLAISCAESVAVLQLLHSVPNSPSPNPETEAQRRSTGYTLSFDKERNLSSTLAFLAHTKDDPNYIPAVCLQEDPGAGYIHVLLTVNKSSPSDGQQTLKVLKEKFDGIFSLLPRVDDGSPDIKDEVFKAIVSMCSKRILQRLRFASTYRNKQKPPIKEALRKATDYLRHAKLSQFDDATLFSAAFSFLQEAKKVLTLIDAYTKHQTQSRLEELIDGIYQLRRQVKPLKALLDTIPPVTMDRSARDHLYNMLSKVARYREAARVLCRTAKAVPLVRRMRTVLVQLPGEAFNRAVLPNAYDPSLEAALAKTQGLKKEERNLARICRLLKISKDEANKQFGSQTRRTLKEAKVHAEIQLLYYIEMRPSTSKTTLQPPRIVCSSKDACWLCNCFIVMYGKIHTPRCHGKLYPGWRLPALGGPVFSDLANRYSQRLQSQVRDSIKVLLVRSERTVYPDPNESTLLTLRWSNSTLASTIPSEAVVEIGDTEVQVVVPTDAQGAKAPTVTRNKEIKEFLPSIRDFALEISRTNREPSGDGSTSSSSLAETTILLTSSSDNSSVNQGEGESKSVIDLPTDVETDAQKDPAADQDDAPPDDEIHAADEDNDTGKDGSPDDLANGIPPNYVPQRASSKVSFAPSLSPSKISTNIANRAPNNNINKNSNPTLCPGETRSKKIAKGKETPLYAVGPLEIQIEYATTSTNNSAPSTTQPPPAISCTVEYLTPTETERLRTAGQLPPFLVDVASLEGEGEIGLVTDAAGCVYLSARDAVVRIRVRPTVVVVREEARGGGEDNITNT